MIYMTFEELIKYLWSEELYITRFEFRSLLKDNVLEYTKVWYNNRTGKPEYFCEDGRRPHYGFTADQTGAVIRYMDAHKDELHKEPTGEMIDFRINNGQLI